MSQVIIRPATAQDVDRVAALVETLGGSFDAAGVADRLEGIDSPQLVAVSEGNVIGLCGLHVMKALHRARPVGRITVLAVDVPWRKKGVGKLLVDAAERYFREIGCELLEVTSNNKLADAHAFYDRLGFEQTSKRFAIRLD